MLSPLSLPGTWSNWGTVQLWLGYREAMETLPKITAGVEGKFGRSGASTYSLSQRRRRQSPLIAKEGAARGHDLSNNTQKDCAVNTKLGL